MAVLGPWILVFGACSPGSSATGDVGSSGDLLVSPRSPWLVTMVAGNPPEGRAREHQLTNSSGKTLEWTAASTQSWLTLSSESGTLDGGVSTTLVVSLDTATVTSLLPGTYAAELRVQATAPKVGEPVSIPVTLTVTSASSSVSIQPEDGYVVGGPSGGPFTPESKTYTVENTGNLDFEWSAVASHGWICSPSPSSGLLSPGSSVQVRIEIDQPLASSLAPGTHLGQVIFYDLTLGSPVTAREVELQVYDSSGWTEFKKSADTRVIYVSSSQGNDANDGLSEATAKRTIGAGMGMLRDGFPDWLLLRKGDTWQEGFGNLRKKGRSANEPLLVTSYGVGARPRLIVPPDQYAILGLGSDNGQYWAFVDLHAEQAGGTGSGSFLAWYCGGGDFLVEGCYLKGFEQCFKLLGGANYKIRRNVIVDSTGQGAYVENVSGCLIEENLIDRAGLPNPDIFKHGLYIQQINNSGIVVRGNIITEPSSHGIQLRCGGIIEDNLFARTSIAILLGGSAAHTYNPPGVVGTIRRNVIIDAKDIDSSQPRGWGINIENSVSALVEENILANSPSCGMPNPIALGASGTVILKNITLRGNVVSGWGGDSLRIFHEPGAAIDNIVIEGNEFQNTVDASYLANINDATDAGSVVSGGNAFFSGTMASNNWFVVAGDNMSLDSFKALIADSSSTAQQVNYKNPAANLGLYHGSLGRTPTYEAFMAEARNQSKAYWRPEYSANVVNAWFRAAFTE